jgi:hypothetical protein
MLKRAGLWSWIAFFGLFVAYFWAPSDRQFPAAPLSAFIFATVLTLVPRSKPVVKNLLCPWNWALLVFFFQLICLPFLVTLTGPSEGVLPRLPSSFAINMAMILNSVAFVTTCCVYNHFSKSKRDRNSFHLPFGTAPATRIDGSVRWIGVFGILGITGIFLSFGNLAGLANYFNDPAFYRESLLDLSSTWRGFLGLLLRPFLGFALIAAWCKWIDLGGTKVSVWRRSVVALCLLVAVVFSFSTFTYNRGAFAVPLIAVATVALVKGDKVAWRMMVIGGLLLLALTPLYALYRSGTLLGEDLLHNPELQDQLLENVEVSDTVQMYGSAPQYLGYLLEESHWGRDPQLGKVTISSLLSPLPLLGKSFRQTSGAAVYNRMIYGTPDIADQVVPFTGESFLDLQVPGILIAFSIFGWVLYRIEQAFEESRSAVEIYLWQYVSIWTCFLIFGSISVLSQIVIYFGWPIYLYFWLVKRTPGHSHQTANIRCFGYKEIITEKTPRIASI